MDFKLTPAILARVRSFDILLQYQEIAFLLIYLEITKFLFDFLFKYNFQQKAYNITPLSS